MTTKNNTRGFLANIGWTVGNHCNAKCGHCYSWKVRRESTQFLSNDEIDIIIEKLTEWGVATVNLGGNEPIYTNGANVKETTLPYIIKRLYGKGIPVGITTNGMTFHYLYNKHPNILKMVNDIDFSLDSPYRAEHDRNRGAALYDFVINAVKRCIALGIDCSIITCGMRKNLTNQYIDDYLSIVAALGCELRINILKPVESPLMAEMPSRKQFYNAFGRLISNTECITLGESCVASLAGQGSAGCPCGRYSFRINAKTKNGTVPISPCVYLHDFRSGDLLKQEIGDIVQGDGFTALSKRIDSLPIECRACHLSAKCQGGCAARAYLINGDLLSKDPYCPKDFLEEGGAFNANTAMSGGKEIRVHDNYLCTWIGKVAEHEKADTKVLARVGCEEKYSSDNLSSGSQDKKGVSSLTRASGKAHSTVS